MAKDARLTSESVALVKKVVEDNAASVPMLLKEVEEEEKQIKEAIQNAEEKKGKEKKEAEEKKLQEFREELERTGESNASAADPKAAAHWAKHKKNIDAPKEEDFPALGKSKPGSRSGRK